jgi:hypothetical protein
MSQLLAGSICLTDLLALAKQGHSAFSRAASNGKVYFNVNIWINDQPDRFDNDASIQVNPKKDSGDEKKYVGNAHFIELRQDQTIQAADVQQFEQDEDDLPF